MSLFSSPLFRKSFAVAFFASAAFTVSAHAGSLTGSIVTCAATSGTCSPGSATVNSTDEFTVTASNGDTVTEEFTGTQLLLTFTVPPGTPGSNGDLPSGFEITNTDETGVFLTLVKQSGSEPTGFNGGSIVNGAIEIDLSGNHVTTGDTLTYNVTAQTPEPESLTLLATGLIAGAGMLRRRIFSGRA